MTVHHAELVSVGPTEAVVTFTTPSDEVVATRVGSHEARTTGPQHVVHAVGLAPDTDHELEVEGTPADDPWLPRTFRTLPQPPGRLLATVATANDVHFGETECGLTGDPATDAIGPILRTEPGDEPYPLVMNRSVVAEMSELDPDAVVVKGDLTAWGLEHEYAQFLDVYGTLGPRMRHVRGNHDAMLDPSLATEGAPFAVEVNGVRLAVLDTTLPGAVGGVLPPDQVAWLDDLAVRVSGPVLVFGHHPVWNDDAPIVDANYAIARDDSLALIETMGHHDNVVGYFAGHTHTNRVVRLGGARVPFVEVACTKDYPGAWAEYRVYEGGYTQVMRRVREPAAFAWAERARGMIQGIYRDLVLGPIEARCFTHIF